jgi:hypothetical protein
VWQLKSLSGISTTAQVPGDIITDLKYAGQIPEPYYETNWIQNASVWMGTNWTYSLEFSYTPTGKLGEGINLNNI